MNLNLGFDIELEQVEHALRTLFDDETTTTAGISLVSTDDDAFTLATDDEGERSFTYQEFLDALGRLAAGDKVGIKVNSKAWTNIHAFAAEGEDLMVRVTDYVTQILMFGKAVAKPTYALWKEKGEAQEV